MATVDLKGVCRITAKGRTYVYAWRGGPRLHAEPGTPEFIAELAAAHAARKAPWGRPTKVAGLIALYKADDAWLKLAPKTRIDWVRWLDRIHDKFGQLSIAAFGRPKIRQAIKRWHRGYKATPRAADMGLQVLSRIMSFAIDEGLLEVYAGAGIAYLYDVDRSDIIWEGAHLAAFTATASKPLVFAMRLAALTGLRQADLLRLCWSHVKENSIEIPTGKSSERKTTLIPLYGELRQLLREIPRLGPVVLTNTDGRPWRTGFRSSVDKAKTRAKLGDLHWHDLRGTAATRFYVAGVPVRAIAEILGWEEDQVLRILRKYVAKNAYLLDLIRQLDEAEGRTPSAKPDAKPVG